MKSLLNYTSKNYSLVDNKICIDVINNDGSEFTNKSKIFTQEEQVQVLTGLKTKLEELLTSFQSDVVKLQSEITNLDTLISSLN